MFSTTPLRDAAIPVYREAAMYAFEAGELDAYRTSMQANMDCKEAIEQTINDYYGNTDLRRSPPLRASLRNSRLSASPMSSRKPSSRKTMTGAFPQTARNGQRAWMAARIMQLNSLLTV